MRTHSSHIAKQCQHARTTERAPLNKNALALRWLHAPGCIALMLLLLLALLLRASRRHRVQFELMGITPSGGHPLRATLGGASTRTAAEHVYAKLYGTFRFCIDDFRDGCHWFEPVDLLRKLALTALLQFVHRGTAAQVLCGCSVAVASLAMQLALLPYRKPDAKGWGETWGGRPVKLISEKP